MSNPFDEFQRAAPAAPANPFDEFQRAAPPVRSTLEVAQQFKPDAVAEAARLAARYPAPFETAYRQLDTLRAHDLVNSRDAMLAQAPALRRYMETNFPGAAMAQDDISTLAKLERFAGNVGSSIKAGVFRASRGVAGTMQAGLELVAPVLDPLEPLDPMATSPGLLPRIPVPGGNPLRRLAEGFAAVGGTAGEVAKAATPKTDNDIEAGFFSGIQSLTQNLLALPMAFAPGGQGAALASMTSMTGGDAYQTAREKGLGIEQALPFAASQAAIEYATEKLPLGALLKDVKAGAGFLQILGRQVALEIPGEQIATVLQDLNEWAVLNPDKPFSTYLEERPSAAVQTLVATIVGAGGNVVVAKGIESVVSRAARDGANLQRAGVLNKSLEEAFTAAGQSLLRQRSPEEFRALMGVLAQDGQVWVDAEVLNQLPADALQQMGATDEVQGALPTNTPVAVKVADALALLAGTPSAEVFMQNARVAPDAPSFAEAEAVSKQAGEFLQQQAEAVIQQAQDQEAARASQEVVKSNLKAQLQATGRFSDAVVDGYASWASAFYTAYGSRMGMSAEQFYQKYPLRILGAAAAGAPAYADAGPRTAGRLDNIEAYHWSAQARPTLSTAFYGTGLRGSARDEIMADADPRVRQRLSFYVDKGTGVRPESGVGGVAHRVNLSNIYDANDDPLKLRGGSARDFEKRVLDAGFSGYLDRLDGTQPGQVILLGEQTVQPEVLGPLSRIEGGQRVPALARREAPWQVQASGTPEQLQARLERMQGNPSWADRYDMKVEGNELLIREKGGVFEQSGRAGGDTAFAERARALLDSRPTPALSTVAIVDGEEEAPRFKNITELAAHFTKRNRAKTKDLADPKTQARIADAIYAETLHALTDAGNAIGWYDRKTRAALDVITEVHPELATDPQARFAFIAILAVTSNGLRSRDNFVIAEQLYRETWKTSGRFPEQVPQGGPRAVAMGETLALLNRKIDELGWEAVRDFMSTKHTAKEVRDFAGAKNFFGEQATSQVPGALFLGPKLGSFFNNLYGDFSTVTMDRWFMRTMNRIRGRMLSLPTSFTDNLGTLREQIQGGVDTYGVKADKILAEITAFGQATPEQQADVLYARGKLKALQQYARARHRDYARPKDDGTGKKRSYLERTPENYLAKNLDLALSGSNDAPFAASDRTWIRGVMGQVQDRLRADGIDISNADLQAVLWYYEKDLYDKLIGKGSQEEDTADSAEAKEAEDYETAARFAVARLQREGLVAGPAGPARSGDAAGGGAGTLSQGGLTDGNRTGRDQGGSLAPLAGAPAIQGASGPDPRLVAVAEQYARANGIQLTRQAEYVQVDPERAARIAQAYDAMEHAPNDPKVREAYDDLARQTMAQYQALEAAGYRFYLVDETNDPYGGNPWNAMRDLRANQSMGVFATEAGFGTSEFDPEGNPLLADTGLEWGYGSPDGPKKRVLFNDLFRAVHDAFGHGLEGAGFRAQGEENAWQAHVRLFTGPAVGAITSETRGQNSWLNYGPYGEANQKAKVEDTVFADQKTGLMPEWTWTEGRAADMAPPVLEQSGGRWSVIDDNVPTREAAQAIVNSRQRGMKRRDGSYSGPGAWEGYEFKIVPSEFHMNGSFQIEARKQGFAQGPQQPRGTFNPATLDLVLNPNADLSTFFHETGHFFLEVMADIAAQPDAPAQIVEDMNTFLKWAGIADLATWNAMTLDQKRPYHERWAEGIEQYVMEGRVPNAELQPLMRRFATWLKSVYQSIKQFLASRGQAPAGGETLGQSAGAAQPDLFPGEFATKRTTVETNQVTDSKGTRAKGGNANSKGQRVTATKQGLQRFWDWFAGSEVTDDKGRPLVLYHSTNSDITQFETNRETTNSYGILGEVAVRRAGIFMTPDLKFSQEYLREGAGQNVMQVYAALKNPLDLRAGLTVTDEQALEAAGVSTRYVRNVQNYWELFDSADDGTNDFVDGLKAAGYDGAIFREDSPSGEGEGGTTYVAFESSQVKSATGNRGAFDANDPRILAQGDQPTGPNLQLNDDIRRVMDRMLATDEQIAQANDEAGLAADPEADAEAQERLRKRSIADLKWSVKARDAAMAKLRKQAREIEKGIREEVTLEVDSTPEMRAKRALDALSITPEHEGLVRVHNEARAAAGSAERARLVAELYEANPEATGLKRGQLLAKNRKTIDNKTEAFLIEWDKANPRPSKPVNASDADVATVADSFGFQGVDAMLEAIAAYGPRQEAIDGITERRMLEEHGDLIDERAIAEAANEAVHNEARARSLATELRTQREMLNKREDTGETNAKGSRITVNALVEAAKKFGRAVADRTLVRDLKSKAWAHTAAERRASAKWQQATAKGETQEAVKAKQDQTLNHAAARALSEAQEEVRKIRDFFARVAKGNDEKVVEKGRDPDIVNAARAILAEYGVQTPTTKRAADYLQLVKANDPETAGAIEPMITAATANAQPLEALSLDELRQLNESIDALWHLAKRSRQMEIDGNLVDRQEIADDLFARMEEIGIPDTIPGEGGAVTKAEARALMLRQGLSFLRRVEQWAEGMDGRYGGPFLRYIFQPVKDAADRYRTDRVAYRKRFQELLNNVAPIVGDQTIEAPELGYTFGAPGSTRGTAMNEILHAIAHTGNESNKRKLLLGRGWAKESADGTLDTTQWDAFINRLTASGVLSQGHYDFVQGVWDLLEDTKPLAQKAHRDAFGRYFAEVTADSFVDPFGVQRRGGYVPAMVDPDLVKDNEIKKLAEDENQAMTFAFPQPAKGFTMSRVENYTRPLMLDLRSLSQHLDKVLLFSHMTGPARDVRKLLTDKKISQPLTRMDPSVMSGMLQPWLQRSAQQVVETPIVGAGKWARVPSVIRARAGAALMFANVSNAIQQVTGLVGASVKVKPAFLMRAMAQHVAHPAKMAKAVWAASPYMDDRAKNEVAVMNEQMTEALLNPTVYEKAQNWSMKHAYFLQTALDNALSPIIWTGGYNQAMADGMTHEDAVRFADGAVRQTQGSTLPEDVSRFETGPAYARIFTQFVGYFNMLANTNATAIQQIAGEVGLKKGAGRAFSVVMLGLMVPLWIAEAIALAFKGGPDDEDQDGYLDDWLASVFGFGTAKGLLALIPIAGQAGMAAVNRLDTNPVNDRVSLSPGISLIESALGGNAQTLIELTDESKDINDRRAVRDAATLVSVFTGLPLYAIARPAGYLAGVADDRIEPTGPLDFARGLITGTPSPESKQ